MTRHSGLPLSPALCLIFFVSGASALLFETLWFRLAGLTFGNSVWASSLVLASFMGGLALGNGLAARRGSSLRRPVRVYAALEVAVGASGLALVLLLPALSHALVPLFRPFLDRPWALNALRLLISFGFMLIPSTAMGATLPVLVKALSSQETNFGRALGRLYGWNTLGAACGALAGEAFLIGWLGLRGTGLVAAFLNGIAALAATALSRRLESPGHDSEADPAAKTPLTPAAKRLLAAAFLSGGILLALEVVWFRFVLLFVTGTSLAFAVMLAVILLGISAGGLLAAWGFKLRPEAHRFFSPIALLCGCATLWVYAGFLGPMGHYPLSVAATSLQLMFPVSLLSGILFTVLGMALKEELPGEARTAGTLTLANTTGAMLGALGGGLVLLPQLGIELSFFVLGLGYGIVAWCGLPAGVRETGRSRLESRLLAFSAALLGLSLALFPFGLMKSRYVPLTAMSFTRDGSGIVAVREGLTETVICLRRDFQGEPRSYRLITNGFSMSGSNFIARRYMKAFVYWPMALHPRAKSALLISYGLGATAKALTDTSGLESIDVVDTSRDILEMSRVVFPDPETHPLNDPRVRVHVEDGRFFLLTTDRRFDLISGEPPPPALAGVVNLYSREYFDLVRSRLSEGGIATYWLPTLSLEPPAVKAIVKAFCSAFEDCSLWNGSALDWMLVGTRGARGPVAEEDFTRQWRDPVVTPELRALGLETPEQLGALFIADAPFLALLTADAQPVTDDRPNRLSPRVKAGVDSLYFTLTDTEATRARFAKSPLVRRLWPAPLREKTLDSFGYQRIINDYFWISNGAMAFGAKGFADIHEVLTRSSLQAPALWLMDSDPDIQSAADRALAKGATLDPTLHRHLGIRSMVSRDYPGAERHLRLAQAGDPSLEPLTAYRILALLLSGDRKGALALVRDARARVAPQRTPREFWAWLEATFGVEDPYATPAQAPTP